MEPGHFQLVDIPLDDPPQQSRGVRGLLDRLGRRTTRPLPSTMRDSISGAPRRAPVPEGGWRVAEDRITGISGADPDVIPQPTGAAAVRRAARLEDRITGFGSQQPAEPPQPPDVGVDEEVYELRAESDNVGWGSEARLMRRQAAAAEEARLARISERADRAIIRGLRAWAARVRGLRGARAGYTRGFVELPEVHSPAEEEFDQMLEEIWKEPKSMSWKVRQVNEVVRNAEREGVVEEPRMRVREQLGRLRQQGRTVQPRPNVRQNITSDILTSANERVAISKLKKIYARNYTGMIGKTDAEIRAIKIRDMKSELRLAERNGVSRGFIRKVNIRLNELEESEGDAFIKGRLGEDGFEGFERIESEHSSSFRRTGAGREFERRWAAAPRTRYLRFNQIRDLMTETQRVEQTLSRGWIDTADLATSDIAVDEAWAAGRTTEAMAGEDTSLQELGQQLSRMVREEGGITVAEARFIENTMTIVRDLAQAENISMSEALARIRAGGSFNSSSWEQVANKHGFSDPKFESNMRSAEEPLSFEEVSGMMGEQNAAALGRTGEVARIISRAEETGSFEGVAEGGEVAMAARTGVRAGKGKGIIGGIIIAGGVIALEHYVPETRPYIEGVNDAVASQQNAGGIGLLNWGLNEVGVDTGLDFSQPDLLTQGIGWVIGEIANAIIDDHPPIQERHRVGILDVEEDEKDKDHILNTMLQERLMGQNRYRPQEVFLEWCQYHGYDPENLPYTPNGADMVSIGYAYYQRSQTLDQMNQTQDLSDYNNFYGAYKREVLGDTGTPYVHHQFTEDNMFHEDGTVVYRQAHGIQEGRIVPGHGRQHFVVNGVSYGMDQINDLVERDFRREFGKGLEENPTEEEQAYWDARLRHWEQEANSKVVERGARGNTYYITPEGHELGVAFEMEGRPVDGNIEMKPVDNDLEGVWVDETGRVNVQEDEEGRQFRINELKDPTSTDPLTYGRQETEVGSLATPGWTSFHNTEFNPAHYQEQADMSDPLILQHRYDQIQFDRAYLEWRGANPHENWYTYWSSRRDEFMQQDLHNYRNNSAQFNVDWEFNLNPEPHYFEITETGDHIKNLHPYDIPSRRYDILGVIYPTDVEPYAHALDRGTQEERDRHSQQIAEKIQEDREHREALYDEIVQAYGEELGLDLRKPFLEGPKDAIDEFLAFQENLPEKESFINGEVNFTAILPEGHDIENYLEPEETVEELGEERALITYGLENDLAPPDYDPDYEPDIYQEDGSGEPNDASHPRTHGHGRNLIPRDEEDSEIFLDEQGRDLRPINPEIGEDGQMGQIILDEGGQHHIVGDAALTYYAGSSMLGAAEVADGDLGQFAHYQTPPRLMIDGLGNVIFTDDSPEAIYMIQRMEQDKTEGHIGDQRVEHKISNPTRDLDLLRAYYINYDCDFNIWYAQRSATIMARNELGTIYQYDYHTFLKSGKIEADHLPFLFGKKEKDYFSIPKFNWIGEGKKTNQMPINQLDAVMCLHKLELWDAIKKVGKHRPDNNIIDDDHRREVDLRLLARLMRITNHEAKIHLGSYLVVENVVSHHQHTTQLTEFDLLLLVMGYYMDKYDLEFNFDYAKFGLISPTDFIQRFKHLNSEYDTFQKYQEYPKLQTILSPLDLAAAEMADISYLPANKRPVHFMGQDGRRWLREDHFGNNKLDMMPSGMRRNLAVYRNLDNPSEVFISTRGTELNNFKDISSDLRFAVESLTPDSYLSLRDIMRKIDPMRFVSSLDDLSKPNLRGGRPWDSQESFVRYLGEAGIFSDIFTALGWFLVRLYVKDSLKTHIIDLIEGRATTRSGRRTRGGAMGALWTRGMPHSETVEYLEARHQEDDLGRHLNFIDEFLEVWGRDHEPDRFIERVREIREMSGQIINIIKVVDIGTIGLSISSILFALTGQGFDEWKEWNRNSEKYQRHHQDKIPKPRNSVLEHRFSELYTLYKSKSQQGDRVFVSGHSLGGIVASMLQVKLKNEGIELDGATFNEGQFLGSQIESDSLTRYKVRGDPISKLGQADVELDGIGGPTARHSLSNFLTKDWEIRRSFDKSDLWSDRSQELSDKWLPFLKETDLGLRLRNFTLSEFLMANYLKKTWKFPMDDEVWKVEVLESASIGVREIEITNQNAHTPPIGLDPIDIGRGGKTPQEDIKDLELGNRRNAIHLNNHYVSPNFLEKRHQGYEDLLKNRPSECSSALLLDLCSQIDLWEEFKERHYGEPEWININRKCSFFREVLIDAILSSVHIVGIVPYVEKRKTELRRNKFLGVKGIVPYSSGLTPF